MVKSHVKKACDFVQKGLKRLEEIIKIAALMKKQFPIYLPLFFSLFSLSFFSLLDAGGGGGGNLGLSHSNTVTWSGTGNNRYDCFDSTAYEQLVDGATKDFYVTYKSGEDTDFFITFSDGGASGYNRVLTKGSYQLSYQLYKSSGQNTVLKEKPDATDSEVIAGHVTDAGKPRKQSQSYYYVVYPEQIVPQGTYTDSVKLRLYKGNLNASHSQNASKNVTFKAIVPAILRLFIGPSGGGLSEVTSYNLDFGELEEREYRDLDLKVLSNAGYEILLNSSNRGNLRHTAYSEVPTSDRVYHQIEYLVDFDGSSIDLSGSGNHLVHTEPSGTASTGDIYDLLITVGSVDEKMHGDYTDELTVTARAI